MNININPFIFRAYDIRGLAINPNGTPDLTPETVELIGKGMGTYMKRTYQTKNMLVGRDNRLHSEQLQQAFIKGVNSTGIEVIDGGLMTSPLVYYSVCKHRFDSGVNITASHNPKDYNGVKIVGKNAHSICGDELQEILKLIQNEDFEKVETPTITTSRDDLFTAYVADITDRIKLGKTLHPDRPLKIVVDTGNGVAGKYAPDFFRALGCDVTELYCELDGNFPNHEANPEVEENLLDLSAKVREIGADLGIGFDGDGDRVGIVDENGKFYSADYLLLFLARDLSTPGVDFPVKIQHNQVIFDIKVSQIIINELKNLGLEPIMSKTGHSFIETKMHKLNAPLAGELSGHMFFGKPHYNYYGFDDAFFGAAKILELLSKSDKPFSEHFTALPKSETTPEFKAGCPDDKKFDIVKNITDHFTREHNCITIDGVRVNFDDQSWGAIRSSNTSPNLTIRFEAPTRTRLAEIQKIMVEELKKYPEVNLSWYKE